MPTTLCSKFSWRTVGFLLHRRSLRHSMDAAAGVQHNANMEFLPSLQQLAAFLLASVLITLAPGPDNLMVLSLGMARGRKAGIAFGLGCAAGCLNHTLLAALGVSALILASPLTFLALQLAGGLYLVWLAVNALRHAQAGSAPASGIAAESGRQLFLKGLLANAINPKVILFFLAFLPQFVDLRTPHPDWQMAWLGVLFTVQAALVFGLIGWFADTLGERLLHKPLWSLWLQRLAGGVFMLVGLRLLMGF